MAKSKLPEKSYLTKSELAARWECEPNDIDHYFQEGLIRFGYELFSPQEKYKLRAFLRSCQMSAMKAIGQSETDAASMLNLENNSETRFIHKLEKLPPIKQSYTRHNVQEESLDLDGISVLAQHALEKDIRFGYVSEENVLEHSEDHLKVSSLQNFDGKCVVVYEYDSTSNAELKISEQFLIIEKSQIIFPIEEISRFEEQHASNHSQGGLQARYNSALEILYGIAISKYGYEPAKLRNSATGENKGSIHSDVSSAGLFVDSQTIKDRLDEAKSKFENKRNS